MKTFTAVIALLAGAVSALPTSDLDASVPATLDRRFQELCPLGLYSVPTCCSVDLLGIADLSCFPPREAYSSWDFWHSCNREGRGPKCCTVEIADIGVLCTDALVGQHY